MLWVDDGRGTMIGDWVFGVPALLVLVGAIIFAFRQGEKVRPDQTKNPDDWKRDTGGSGL